MNKFIFCMLLIGTLLRVIWPADMEWKSDEQTLTAMAVKAASLHTWPDVGIPSSQGVPNPGLSVWLITLISKLSTDPVFIVSVIQWLNALAIWGFVLFILWQFNEEERVTWLLGLALFSVSPLPVLYSRKIWQQCLVPPFTLALFIGHYRRKNNWGSFLWGLSGVLIAQIHMAGFFIVPSLLIATLFYEFQQDKKMDKKPLFYWLIGTLIGAVGLIPWILSTHPGSGLRHLDIGYFKQIISFQFFVRWLLDVFGFGIKYYAKPIFWNLFTTNPLFGLAHLLCLVIGTRSLITAFKNRVLPSGLYPLAFFWFYGFSLTLLGHSIPPHYLILAYPFTHIICMQLIKEASLRKLLILSQAVITCVFLYFVHAHGGAPGEYQSTFSSQTYGHK